MPLVQESIRDTHIATLESKASCSAASPVTASPLVSFSISKPPSYLPMSKEGLEGCKACEDCEDCVDCEDCEDWDWGFAGAGGRVGEVARAACLLASAFVDATLCSDVVVVRGFGAAYLERSLDTFVWLGFFWCWDVGGRAAFCLEDISRAVSWRVSCPTEVMVGFARAR